jgi:RimJ/RimL family protein N-acetyltransferase
VLAGSKQLPKKPLAPTLHGRRVTLRPIDLSNDLISLYAKSNGEAAQLGSQTIAAYDATEQIWRYMFGGPFGSAAELGNYLQPQIDAMDGTPLCVEVEGVAVGVYNLLANSPEHRRIELGGIWYSPLAQRRGCNDEATWLLLRYLFDLGYRRVEWKCDSDNERSKAAALALGFSYEGTFESHMIVKGRSRNTAWFRMLDRDWPDAEPLLARRVSSRIK